jgi:redox-sensitive bicupin YhaK (pirin superfamily)
VVVGELLEAVSPALAYTPLLGAELRIDGEVALPVSSAFEHGVLGIDGDLRVEGLPLGASELYYLGGGREVVRLAGSGRAFLLGGAPFTEELVMWWNFIGRSHEEIVAFRDAWNAGGEEQFGVVRDFDGERLLAPPMPAIALKPRGRRP